MHATSDFNKGWQFLRPTLHRLKETGWQDKVEVVIFGVSTPEVPIDMGFPCHYLGKLYDDLTLAVMYAAADVTLVPSKQESFGQTASESLACGTPVVAFGVTGLLDIVTHQSNGYLAIPFDCEDLANGINWVLTDPHRHQNLRISARKKAEEEFDQLLQAQRYQELFHKILNLPN
jgi:glycosyltransferase involved in cell wall biosynthesis